jgi:hypothetical protein
LFSLLQSDAQFEKDDVFSDVDESLEGSSPIAESHDLNELSALGRARQSEGADTARRMHDGDSPQKLVDASWIYSAHMGCASRGHHTMLGMQEDTEGFVDLAQRAEQDDEAEAGAEAQTTQRTTYHHREQEPEQEHDHDREREQDEFQDLESVGQEDDLYDFEDHRNVEESDHFGTPSADKVRESLSTVRCPAAEAHGCL